MNTMRSASITVTRSMGVWLTSCMFRPPTCRMAKRNAATTTPEGLARPRSASAIASNPMPEENPEDSCGVALTSWLAPARPASAPQRPMTTT